MMCSVLNISPDHVERKTRTGLCFFCQVGAGEGTALSMLICSALRASEVCVRVLERELALWKTN